LDILAGEPLTIQHPVPMTIRRRGVEMRMIIDSPTSPSKADPSLLKAIVRARGWFDDLLTGRISSLSEIARREGHNASYISHLIPLAFLAPKIVEAIADGRHPVDLSAESLVKHINLPLAWDDQKARLGFT
jgi:hypothetical protein